MNLRPGNLSKFFVCHSLRAGFFDVFPTIGFWTTASLKWSTTAAMAKTPPSRSYKLCSLMVSSLNVRARGSLVLFQPSLQPTARRQAAADCPHPRQDPSLSTTAMRRRADGVSPPRGRPAPLRTPVAATGCNICGSNPARHLPIGPRSRHRADALGTRSRAHRWRPVPRRRTLPPGFCSSIGTVVIGNVTAWSCPSGRVVGPVPWCMAQVPHPDRAGIRRGQPSCADGLPAPRPTVRGELWAPVPRSSRPAPCRVHQRPFPQMRDANLAHVQDAGSAASAYDRLVPAGRWAGRHRTPPSSPRGSAAAGRVRDSRAAR